MYARLAKQCIPCPLVLRMFTYSQHLSALPLLVQSMGAYTFTFVKMRHPDQSWAHSE